jgi:hypothetical protein
MNAFLRRFHALRVYRGRDPLGPFKAMRNARTRKREVIVNQGAARRTTRIIRRDLRAMDRSISNQQIERHQNISGIAICALAGSGPLFGGRP